MKARISTVLAATTAGLLWLGATHAFAQEDAPPPPPPPPQEAPAANGAAPAGAGAQGARPGGGGGDQREQFRQRMNERIKAQLKASDDEWAVIQPLLDNVQTKLRENMENRFRGAMGAGGPRRGGNNADANRPAGNTADAARPDANRPRPDARRTSPEAQALTDALANDNSSTNDIKAKLQALREQRKKAEADLAQAREDLKKVLSMRQEAVLVSMGMLD